MEFTKILRFAGGAAQFKRAAKSGNAMFLAAFGKIFFDVATIDQNIFMITIALVGSSHKHQYLQPRGLVPNNDGAKFQTDAPHAMARAVDRDPEYPCDLCPVPLELNRDAVPRAGLDPQMARLQKR